MIHPQYDSATARNDIALVQLNQTALINNFVSPICLPNGEQPSVGELCYATGYGNTGNLVCFIRAAEIFSYAFTLDKLIHYKNIII